LVAAATVVVLGLGIQLVPVDRSNPPVVAELDAPPEVRAVLDAACSDCHSHRTRWPWYSRVAPVSWLVANDVREAREKLNFSTWGTLEPREQWKAMEEIGEEVEDGEMPLLMYRLAHPEARLDERQRATLLDWARSGGRQR
jgi:hypothetical protein